LGKLGAALLNTELEPRNAQAYNTRGHVLEALGRKSEAIADYRRALLLDRSLVLSQDGLKRLGAAK
jgi:hypothetical protein